MGEKATYYLPQIKWFNWGDWHDLSGETTLVEAQRSIAELDPPYGRVQRVEQQIIWSQP